MTPIEAQEGYIPVTGGRVWYQIIGAGDAIPLLVLHGGPGVPHDYLEPLADLADERPVVFYGPIQTFVLPAATDPPVSSR